VRVDLVIPSLGLGGSERQLVGLASRLSWTGVNVRVITMRDGGSLKRDLSAADVAHVSLDRLVPRNASNSFSRAWALARLWRRGKPDAVQAWLPEAQLISLPIARRMGIPQRWMVLRSMSDAVNLSPLSRLGLAYAAQCSTLVVGNCRAVTEDLGWPIGNRPRIVIPNAVELPARAADTSTQPAQGVVVANFTSIKGHSDLLDALSQVRKPPQMTLLGSGPEAIQIAATAQRLGLGAHIDIREGVSDPYPILLESQFLVLPSPSEGMPNAVLEAMSAGLPVIAYRVGGIPELVEHGQTGMLVTPGDTPGLARAIENVATDACWRRCAGAKAREVSEMYSWDVLLRSNLELLRAKT
jgi:glycosyltransferase involved in cell wall biosynthesis